MNIKILFFLLIFISTGYSFEKCGKYRGEGMFSKINNHYTLKLNYQTESEITLTFKDFKLKNKDLYVDTPLEIDFLINKKCRFKCDSIFVKINKKINPLKTPKLFSKTRPKPITPTKCLK